MENRFPSPSLGISPRRHRVWRGLSRLLDLPATLHISVPSLSGAPWGDTVAVLRRVHLYSPLLSFVNLPAPKKGH